MLNLFSVSTLLNIQTHTQTYTCHAPWERWMARTPIPLPSWHPGAQQLEKPGGWMHWIRSDGGDEGLGMCGWKWSQVGYTWINYHFHQECSSCFWHFLVRPDDVPVCGVALVVSPVSSHTFMLISSSLSINSVTLDRQKRNHCTRVCNARFLSSLPIV